MRHEIIRRVQALAVKAVGNHRHRAVEFPADDAAEEVLGGELPPLEVERVAVAVVGRLAEHADAPVVPQHAELRVALHIAEYEVLTLARPRWAFAPAEASGDSVDSGDAEQILLERWIDHDDVGIGVDLRCRAMSPLTGRIADN